MNSCNRTFQPYMYVCTYVRMYVCMYVCTAAISCNFTEGCVYVLSYSRVQCERLAERTRALVLCNFCTERHECMLALTTGHSNTRFVAFL